MDVHRFGGARVNLDTLDQDGFNILQHYTNQRMRKALGEIAVLNLYAAEHDYQTTSHVELPEFKMPTALTVHPDQTYMGD